MLSKRTVRGRKKRKELNLAGKEKRGPSTKIWVNGVELLPKQVCQFCEQRLAVVHCLECDHHNNGTGDYLCDRCDMEVHRHAKRACHVRTFFPEMDAEGAKERIVGLFRRARARVELLAKCRERYTRYYDSKSRQYFYYESRSGEVTWTKPSCLKRCQELAPFPSFEEAAFRIQNMFRCRQAREELITRIRVLYDKIFSREYGCFYYHFNGASSLCPRVSWDKPRFLYWRDLKPFKNDDVAALFIQRQWLAFKSRRFMLNSIRAYYRADKDPVSGRHVYTSPDGRASTRKPPLLGREHFDPEDMSLWDTYTLSIWMRRMGFKKIAPELFKFKIDGALFLAFEWDDFVDLGITQSHQIKRILLDIEQRAFFATHRDQAVTLARRDRLRYHHKVEAACVVIQTKYRKRYRRILRERLKETAHLLAQRERLRKDREAGTLWWAKRVHRVKVPDHGKTFGNDRLFDSVRGRGSFHKCLPQWTPTDIPTPMPHHYKRVLANNAMLQARGLHFSGDSPELIKDRTKMMSKLSFESLTALAAKERGQPPPKLASIHVEGAFGIFQD